ncbi:MAG TPA: nuclear transport factor 2 family protein [Polyangiaceae bacterium]|nr:nuclear transport factor 2 family protein [Polyangiaceae bacterium]
MRSAVEELVYRSCLLLDEHDFGGFLALCTDDFRYTVEAFSPEIRKNMIWLDHDKAGMKSLFETLPRHFSDPSPVTRHVTVYTVTFDTDGPRAAVVSALQVFRTALDGGTTSLFAVGKLYDTVVMTDGRVALAKRVLRLATRDLGIGSHVPL